MRWTEANLGQFSYILTNKNQRISLFKDIEACLISREGFWRKISDYTLEVKNCSRWGVLPRRTGPLRGRSNSFLPSLSFHLNFQMGFAKIRYFPLSIWFPFFFWRKISANFKESFTPFTPQFIRNTSLGNSRSVGRAKELDQFLMKSHNYHLRLISDWKFPANYFSAPNMKYLNWDN